MENDYYDSFLGPRFLCRAEKGKIKIITDGTLTIYGAAQAYFDGMDKQIRESERKRSHDFEAFAQITKKLDIQIVEDDFLVSNIKRLQEAVKMGAANCVLLKVNQIGTLTEALETNEFAKRNGYGVLVSERSAQTEDTWLAELTVGINAGQIKK